MAHDDVDDQDYVGRRFPVLWGPLSDEERQQYIVLGCPHTVAWELVAPHEAQALKNHDQTLERLAERGGLSPAEMMLVLDDKEWSGLPVNDIAAIPLLQHRILMGK